MSARRFWVATLMAVALAIGLSACSDGNDSANAATGNDETAESDTDSDGESPAEESDSADPDGSTQTSEIDSGDDGSDTDDTDGSETPGEADFAEASWQIRPGVAFLEVTDAEPNEPLTLFGEDGTEMLTVVADDLGQASFQYLPFEPATIEAGPDSEILWDCLLYTSPSPRDATLSRMPSSA